MKKIIFCATIFIVANVYGGNRSAFDNKNSSGNSSQPNGLHEDWFEAKFDDVREITTIKTKDVYGPGDGAKDSLDEMMKISIGCQFEGKAYDPQKPVVVTINFSRMAGMKMKNNDALLGSKEDVWKPYYKNQLFLMNDCSDVLFLTKSGEKISFKGKKISYKQTNSFGFMGEQYQWESLIVTTDAKFLNKTLEGCKASLCDISLSFSNDNISQAKSLFSLLGGLKSRQPDANNK